MCLPKELIKLTCRLLSDGQTKSCFVNLSHVWTMVNVTTLLMVYVLIKRTTAYSRIFPSIKLACISLFGT